MTADDVGMKEEEKESGWVSDTGSACFASRQRA